jgi:hypothetical protein
VVDVIEVAPEPAILNSAAHAEVGAFSGISAEDESAASDAIRAIIVAVAATAATTTATGPVGGALDVCVSKADRSFHAAVVVDPQTGDADFAVIAGRKAGPAIDDDVTAVVIKPLIGVARDVDRHVIYLQAADTERGVDADCAIFTAFSGGYDLHRIEGNRVERRIMQGLDYQSEIRNGNFTE